MNWPSIKSGGITFAWAKATEGQGVNDSTYTAHMQNGKAAGIIMGSYHYAHPELNSAATEASHFWGRAATWTKSDGLTLMPMLDVEGSAFSGHVGSTSVSDWCNDWCTDIVADGQGAGSLSLTPIIYVSACNACGFDSSVGQWGADIANYSGNSAQTSTPGHLAAVANVGAPAHGIFGNTIPPAESPAIPATSIRTCSTVLQSRHGLLDQIPTRRCSTGILKAPPAQTRIPAR